MTIGPWFSVLHWQAPSCRLLMKAPSHAQGVLVGSLMCHGHHHLLLCIGGPRLSMLHLHGATPHIAKLTCQPYWGGKFLAFCSVAG